MQVPLHRREFVAGGVALLSLPTVPRSAYGARGNFTGRIVTSWNKDGRTMTVEQGFEYIDSDRRRWPVPAGATVDGASIPQAFWSFIGGPFDGRYRDASVVHDHYCQTRTRRDQHVHKVFHEAMLTSGVSEQKAWFMWKAVDRFGPRWADPKVDPRCEVVDANYDFEKCAQNSAPPAATMRAISKSELQKLLSEVEAQSDPSDKARLKDLIAKTR